MDELRDTSCYPKIFVGVDLALVGIDGLISVFAFYQVCSVLFCSVPILNLFLAIKTHIATYTHGINGNV